MEIYELADGIIQAQVREIAEMEDLISDLEKANSANNSDIHMSADQAVH